MVYYICNVNTLLQFKNARLSKSPDTSESEVAVSSPPKEENSFGATRNANLRKVHSYFLPINSTHVELKLIRLLRGAVSHHTLINQIVFAEIIRNDEDFDNCPEK